MTIISRLHNLIFIKTSKTAGTSIEVDLSQRVEENAVVTPIYPQIRGHKPRHHLSPEGDLLFTNHMPARDVRRLLGPDQYSKMLSFCVEREPVEKCISHFHMRRNSSLHNPEGQNALTWEEYCEAGLFPLNHTSYAENQQDNWQLIVDQVLRYDDLANSLPKLLAGRGIPDFQLTARAKSDYSQNRLISKAEVTTSQRRKIYDAFSISLDVTKIDWNKPPSQDPPAL